MTKTKCFFLILGLLFASFVYATDDISRVKQQVAEAINDQKVWNGPKNGPKIQNQKSIVLVGSDLRNGGVNALAKGVSEAISHVEWDLRLVDGYGSDVRQGAAIRRAISMKPDAIILCGIDAKKHGAVLNVAKKLGIVVIGWHAINEAASMPSIGLFTNITTDPRAVAEMAVKLAIIDSKEQAKVVIFTDPDYDIATAKSDAMQESLSRCPGCELLSVEEVSLDETAKQMPIVLDRLMRRYGNDITHLLVINDLYIDFAIPSFETNSKNLTHIPVSISAGDGSRAAYRRILNNRYQIATVPEPLYQQGWQIVDELNRAFHHQPPSGYIAPVHLVTSENVKSLMGSQSDVYDPDNGYREAYLKIWKSR